MSPRALVILAQGFEETEAITTIDLLRRGGIDTVVAGLTGREVTGAHGIVVTADQDLDAAGTAFDAVVLPGGQPGTTNLAASHKVLSLVVATFRSGKLCAAICAAPLVLAKTGILAGKKATCFPGVESRMADAHVVAEPVVVDGNVITSRGVGTAIAFGLALVAYLADQATADKVATAIVYRP